MLIIISARAPFYNTVISSYLDPKYGIWGGEAVTVRLGLVWGGGGIMKCESLKRSPRKRMSTSRMEQVWMDTELLKTGLVGGHWEFLRFPRDFLLRQK